jgi:predicted membrane-bound spermidine synthase
VGLLGSITTNFMFLSALTTIVISLLVGVNIALMLYLYRRQKAGLSRNGIAVSTFVTIIGMFGIGCAACGSLILTGLLSVVGGVGVLTLFPFQGQELGIVGVIVLLYATYFLVQKIIRSITCEVQ